MPTREESLGAIDISATTIITIASQAINQCYGVVGMASKNMVDGLARMLSRDSQRGLEVAIVDNEIVIDVYVIIQYGVNIKEVAGSIQRTVKFHVEQALDWPVQAVNVYVQGLRRSDQNS